MFLHFDVISSFSFKVELMNKRLNKWKLSLGPETLEKIDKNGHIAHIFYGLPFLLILDLS